MSEPVVDDDFSGGAIRVVRAGRRGPIELALRGDSASEVSQWFAFRVRSQRPRELVIRDIASATFAGAWERYQAMVSTDGRRWRRAPTELDGSSLVIAHPGGEGAVRYAYFAPYEERRLQRLLARLSAEDHVSVGPLAVTPLGRTVPLVVVGDDEAARTVWITARQHPGETPASWAVEGLMRRLADRDDPGTRELLERARVLVAPLMCLDGAHLGNHRTSSSGADLNRTWDDPDPDDAPEVAAALSAMDDRPPDVFLDLHADEATPYAFAAGCEGNPSWDEARGEEEAAFVGDLAARSPDFFGESFYERDEPGEGDLSCAANAVGERWGALALTIELPMGASGQGFIRDGWSPARAAALGADLIDTLVASLSAGD